MEFVDSCLANLRNRKGFGAIWALNPTALIRAHLADFRTVGNELKQLARQVF